MGCDFLFEKNTAIMVIDADDVTIKNFGFKGAIWGIRISDFGEVRKNIKLQNVEGDACFRGISFPDQYENFSMDGVSVVVWRD